MGNKGLLSVIFVILLGMFTIALVQVDGHDSSEDITELLGDMTSNKTGSTGLN